METTGSGVRDGAGARSTAEARKWQTQDAEPNWLRLID
jgi:hypothetical protein